MPQRKQRTKYAVLRRGSSRTGTTWGWSLTAACVGSLALSSYAGRSHEQPKSAAKAPTPRNTVAGLAPEDARAFSERFSKELWPVLQKSCMGCHGDKNASQLTLPHDSKAAFLLLLSDGRFDAENHSSLDARVTTTDQQILMPPSGTGTLTRTEAALFEKFAEDLAARRAARGTRADEEFPAHLRLAFEGEKHRGGLDNTFVTFRQLRGKIQTVFGDDWKRDDVDLFVQNAPLFGGADFIKRFDETSKAAPTFLTGVDMLGRDVASRAYLARTGPFAGFPDALPSPAAMPAPDSAYRSAINHLYNRMLFRDAAPEEIAEAWAFVKRVYAAQDKLAQTGGPDLRFRLTVSDDAGMKVNEDVTVGVTADAGHALTQEFVDQSRDSDDGKTHTASRTLYDEFTFAPGDDGQKIVVTNAETHGNVSLASVTIRGPLPLTTERIVTVEDPQVRPEGAWHIRKDNSFVSYEDNNENKGASRITFPVKVDKPGKYEVAVTWRRYQGATPPKPGKKGTKPFRGAPANGAENVLVEVTSRDKQSQLAVPAPPPIPPKGEAHFDVDQTLDTIPYADLKTAFRFDAPTDGIELRNDGTRKRVVADAVRLLPPVAVPNEVDTAPVLKATDAVGKTQWVEFKKGTFRAYNTVGPDLFQDTDDTGNKREGVSLTFRPKPGKTEGFTPSKFYRVGVVYPGQVENETRVPVVVHASASSPIVQIVHPYHASVGAPVTLDASSTYNLQHSPLKFQWEQIGGPRVHVANPNAPTLRFAAPALTAQQAAWEGLCRALLSHPDFLFTRPRSLADIRDPKQRQRLQLVKIAQDLLSRAPTQAELAQMDAGTPLAKIVDGYLASPQFKDFYFHRVRLYVESHGTPEQDEPARLWTWIALNNRPFKEILTADYTVDTNWQKQTRPAYYGKTGVLTMKGFIQGKPGLPHFNYPAQVTEKFLGYVFEVPDSVLAQRDGITAAATTDPSSVCYTCHKVLTPLAYQRSLWDDDGNFRVHDETGMKLDDSDQGLVKSYPYKGAGIEAFALQAQNKERFIRTILQTHFVWYFGREMRYDTDERGLYARLWNVAAQNNYAIRPLVRAIVLSPEYLNGSAQTRTNPKVQRNRMSKLAQFHAQIGRTAKTADNRATRPARVEETR